jgi:type I restriction enzyme S subunit
MVMMFDFPDGWQLGSVEDSMKAIIDYRGKTPRKTLSGIPLITARIVKDGRIMTPTEFIASEGYDSWMNRGLPEPGDVVMTTEAPLGEIAQINSCKVALGQRLITLRGKPDLLNNTYLKFAMQTTFVQNQLKARATGTTVLGISQRELRKVEIPLPPLQEQHRIAHILGTLDDKIELNRQVNETLEATARAIFKSWFIDFDPVKAKIEGHKPVGMDTKTASLFSSAFQDSPLGKIPKGWQVGTIDEDFNLTMGQSPPGSTYNEDEKGLPFYQGRKDFSFRYPTRRVYCTSPKRFAKKGDTLVSVRAPVGDVNMANEKCCVGRGLASLRHKTGSRSYTYYAMQFLQEIFSRYEAEGTVFGSINKTDFQTLSQLRPFNEIIEVFERLIHPLDQSIENNEHESDTLSQIRDMLLPKLLSGEIRVDDANEILEVKDGGKS